MKYINFSRIQKRIQNIFNKGIDALILVDISSNLKLLHVQLSPEPKISALKIIELVSDKRDEIIFESLRSFIQENNLQHKNAILSPSLKSLLIKRIQLPAIPQTELLEAIKWQLKEEVSFDLSGAVIDFSILGEKSRDDGAKVLDILCVIAQKQEIEPQALLLRQVGLNCLAVIPLVFGYTKLIAKYFSSIKKEAAAGILHIGDDTSCLTIHQDNKLAFYREVPLSINKLKEALKGVLISDKGKVELSDKEAEEVLYQVGVPQEDLVYKDKLSSTHILSLLRPILERLVQEIKRSLTYYTSQLQGSAVNKIMVAGLRADIPPNIDKFLSQELSLEIHKISLIDKNIALPQIDPRNIAQSYAAFGLALDYSQNINLLPHEFRMEKFEKLQKVSLRWVAFAAFLLLVFSYLFAKVGVSSYQKRLDNAILHLNVLSEVKQIKTSIDEFNKFIIDIRKSEFSISAGLNKISGITARELFFENLSLDCDSKVLKISGFVKNTTQNADATLNKFVRDMENSAYFSSANMSSVERIKSQDTEIVKFNITFKLR